MTGGPAAEVGSGPGEVAAHPHAFHRLNPDRVAAALTGAGFTVTAR